MTLINEPALSATCLMLVFSLALLYLAQPTTKYGMPEFLCSIAALACFLGALAIAFSPILGWV